MILYHENYGKMQNLKTSWYLMYITPTAMLRVYETRDNCILIGYIDEVKE